MSREKIAESIPRSILVVEDDYFIANDLARGLTSAGLNVVGPAASVQDALELFKTRRVDGAVLDLNLDDETAYVLAELLIRRGMPIVLVSGYEPSAVPERLRRLPFCRKPFDLAQVLEALEPATPR